MSDPRSLILSALYRRLSFSQVLSKALEVNRSLQKLSLVGNALSDFGVQARRSNLEPGEEAPCMRVCVFVGLSCMMLRYIYCSYMQL